MDNTASDNQGLCRNRLERIRPFIQRYVDDGLYAGVSTLVARHGIVVHQEQVGYADLAAGVPMTADTLCRVYSMTKPVASVALMMLFDRGRFDLDDPVERFLPAFSGMRIYDPGGFHTPAAGRITIRQLLNHTSGLILPARICWLTESILTRRGSSVGMHR